MLMCLQCSSWSMTDKKRDTSRHYDGSVVALESEEASYLVDLVEPLRVLRYLCALTRKQRC